MKNSLDIINLEERASKLLERFADNAWDLLSNEDGYQYLTWDPNEHVWKDDVLEKPLNQDTPDKFKLFYKTTEWCPVPEDEEEDYFEDEIEIVVLTMDRYWLTQFIPYMYNLYDLNFRFYPSSVIDHIQIWLEDLNNKEAKAELIKGLKLSSEEELDRYEFHVEFEAEAIDENLPMNGIELILEKYFRVVMGCYNIGDSEYLYANYRIAQSYFDQGRYDEAFEACQIAERLAGKIAAAPKAGRLGNNFDSTASKIYALIAKMYALGQGTAKDLDKTRHFYQKVSGEYASEEDKKMLAYLEDPNDASLALELGRHYLGEGQLKQALEFLQPLAEKGHSGAQLDLGRCYAEGRGVAKDEKEAVRLYRLAAEQRLEDAEYELALCLRYGSGVKKDSAKSLTLLSGLAQRGHVDSMYALGDYYFEKGKMEEAFPWWKMAAHHGNVSAQTNIGNMYKYGDGVEQDFTEAFKWYTLAADGGDVSVYFELGGMYFKGEGVAKDNDKALECYNKVIAADDYYVEEAEEMIKQINKEAKKAPKVQPPKTKSPAKSEASAKTKSEAVEHKKATPTSEFKPAQAPKPVAKEKISIPQTGPTTKLDFWQALKPYLDKLKHQEFSRIALKDVDYLDARPTVIAGVYNSIIMRVGKKILRLMVTINTDTAAGNLKIIDHVQKNIKIPATFKGRVEFDRKEGRHSQIIMLNFDGFELTDRSCWAKYITELVSVNDDFFDAVEKPMRDLI